MYQEVFKLHAEVLQALAHPRRLEIINLLRHAGMPVTQMQNMLGLPQANISQHLQVLRKCGVVADERRGKQVFYKIAHKNFLQASDLVREVLLERYEKTPLGKVMKKEIEELLPVVTDPVCGMRVSKKTAARSLRHDGKHYYFCASGCWQSFQSHPTSFIP